MLTVDRLSAAELGATSDMLLFVTKVEAALLNNGIG
jgi:hypothetical protein